MNPADIAIIAVTATGLANVWVTYRLHMRVLDKVGDRVRVVNPPREQQQEQKEPARVPDLTARRPA